MRNKYQRIVKFRDANKTMWEVEVSVNAINQDYIDGKDLIPYRETKSVSFCGTGGGSVGQVYDHIEPRTESQKKLIELWRRYHLNGMSNGSDKQESYLKTQYNVDYDALVKAFKDKNECTGVLECVHDVIPFNIGLIDQIVDYIKKWMGGDAVHYILSEYRYDYRTQCFCLMLRGLYNDRGYVYGTAHTHSPIPQNIEEVINKTFNEIEKDEDEYSNTLDPVFYMAEDLEVTPELVNKVMELRDCSKTEAKRFIALGMFFSVSFGDLNETFQRLDDFGCYYQAFGDYYYIGTDEELYDVAYSRMCEGDYDDIWRSQVQDQQTEMGLQEWRKYVIEVDGWCSILNHWDGKYETYRIVDEEICVSRT